MSIWKAVTPSASPVDRVRQRSSRVRRGSDRVKRVSDRVMQCSDRFEHGCQGGGVSQLPRWTSRSVTSFPTVHTALRQGCVRIKRGSIRVRQGSNRVRHGHQGGGKPVSNVGDNVWTGKQRHSATTSMLGRCTHMSISKLP